MIAIVLIGALAASASLIAVEASRDGDSALREAQALAAAESGAADMVRPSVWQAAWNLAPAGRVTARAAVWSNGATDSVQLVRLDASEYAIIAEGRAGPPSSPRRQARRAMTLLVTLRVPFGRAPAVLTVGAPPPGGGRIDAADRDPARDSGCSPAAPVTALRVDTAGAPLPLPPGGDAWRALAVRAARELPARAVLTDPRDATASLTHARGDVRIVGGVVRGFWLVDGDLTLSEGAELAGVAVVRGALTLRTGARVRGAAYASRARIDASSAMTAASCAEQRARWAAGVPTWLVDRPWADRR